MLRYGALRGPILIEVHGSQVAPGRGIAGKMPLSPIISGKIGKFEKLFLHFLIKSKRSPGMLREILYGMTVHEMDLELRKEIGSLDHLFMLVVFGDLVALPLLPPYHSMRLLPFIIPSLQTWKRSVLREKDLTDFVSADL
jgi:hypothetical protein